MKKLNFVFLTAAFCLIGLFIVQLIFFGLLQATSNRIASTLFESLNFEFNQANLNLSTTLLKNMEKNELINCARLSLKKKNIKLPIYQSNVLNHCTPNPFLLTGIKIDVDVLSLDGRNWNFQFVTVTPIESIFLLWMSRILFVSVIIVLALFLHNRAAHVEEIKKQIDLHIRGIAHDLASPLGSLRLLIDNQEHLKNPMGFGLLCKSTKRIINISESILEGRVNTLPVFSKGFDILESCEEIISEKVSAFALNGKAPINIAFSASLLKKNSKVLGRDDKFKRILSNLLNNSIEALVTKGDCSSQINVNLTENQSHVTVDLIDNGHGIDKKILPKLGKLPVQSRKAKGCGIGLILAKMDLKSWEGDLNIKSEVGKGTLVRLLLKKA